MDLGELRKKINQIDAGIVRLIVERYKLAEQIGDEKKKQQSPVMDMEREKKVLEAVKKLAAEEGINDSSMEEIYREIINLCRNSQGIKVAFLGEAGDFGEQAAFDFIGTAAELVSYDSLDEIFSIVQDGVMQFGVVPVENSLEGSVARTYDLLLESNVQVCGEEELKIIYSLMSEKEMPLESVKTIYSTAYALAQCKRFVKQVNRRIVPVQSIAETVKNIREKNLDEAAIIASKRASKIHGMNIISSDIEDNTRNITRYFIIGEKDSPPTGNDKTSIVFASSHKSGTLHKAINEFAKRGINLTRIESRPTRQNPWEYNFFLDCEGHREDKKVSEALEDLKKVTFFVKVLGSYPRAK